MNKLIAIFFLVVLAFSPSRAQSSATAPLVNVPPPGSIWSVKIEDTSADKASSGPVLLTMKAGTNGVTLGQITYSDNRQVFFYAAAGSLFVQASNSKTVFSQSVEESSSDPFSLQVDSFPGISWIAADNFKGVEKKNGFDCRHYAKKINSPGTPELRADAWIREEDHYPAEIKVGKVVFRMGPVGPYSGEVQLPSSFRDRIAEEKAQQTAMEAIRRANAAQ